MFSMKPGFCNSAPSLFRPMAMCGHRALAFIDGSHAQGGEVFTLLKSIMWKEEVLKIHSAQMVSALDCMHQTGLVYRDVKPENVILDSAGNCVFADFGLSCAINSTGRECAQGGTASYMAPEV